MLLFASFTEDDMQTVLTNHDFIKMLSEKKKIKFF